MEWERWFDLFAVAVMAKYSISIEELIRTTDVNSPRIKALIGDMAEEAAEKKVVTWLFLSVGEPARKMFKDKHPNLSVWTLGVRDMTERCRNCFHVAPNRTLDRHKFLSRKQQNNESLQQFWNALNGLASRCELGEITQTLVHDVFILNMNNKKVQEKLCVEPFDDPQDALKYAISYEEGVKSQKTMGIGVAESSKTAIKTEPVCAVEKVNKRECFRCGVGNFTTDHIKKCPATNHKCEFCDITGHLEKCCNQKYPERRKQMKQRLQSRRRGMARINYISEDSEEWDDDEMVLQVIGEGAKPFMMEGLMCGKKFQAIIDTGSPVSIFAIDELERIIGKYWVVVREMIDDERYVDFNRRPLPLLGYMFVSIQVGKTRMSKARVLVANKGAKSIVGRDWLTALKYKIEQPMTRGENIVNSISCESANPEIKLSPEANQLVEEFPNLFKRRGRVNNYKIKIDMKDGTRVTQQKGRRIPLQLQDQVDKEIKQLLEQGQIEKVDTIKDDVFIQPVVITVKKDRSVKIALDARALNNSIANDKYQMPNLENLMDMIAEKIDGKEGEV